MSKSKNIATPVPAKRVREAFAQGLFTVPDEGLACLVGKNGDGKVRGRLNPIVVEAFNAQVTGEVYAGEKSPVEAKSVTLALTKPNAKGARLKRPESFPLAEVRKRAGVEGKAGRLSKANLAAAADSIMRERGWL